MLQLKSENKYNLKIQSNYLKELTMIENKKII